MRNSEFKNLIEKQEEPRIYNLKGLDFSQEEIKKAWTDDAPLRLSIAFPREKCNLDCLYCFTAEYKNKEKITPIDKTETSELLEEAKAMGVKNLVIGGYGEPFLNKEIWGILEKAKELGLYITIFSNGALITKEVAAKLKEMPVSFVIKLNSLNKEKESRLAGKENFGDKQQEGINYLINFGFNNSDENGNTRLAVNSIVCKNTVEDVPMVVKWAIENNIKPMISGLVLRGAAYQNQNVLGNEDENEQAWFEVEHKIQELYPSLYDKIFTSGEKNLSKTFSIAIEQFTGNVTETLLGGHNIDRYGSHTKLKDIWQKGKKERQQIISQFKENSIED
jgi:MoaA/NifB/PqqE/SkfB family radical SAM enzyme